MHLSVSTSPLPTPIVELVLALVPKVTQAMIDPTAGGGKHPDHDAVALTILKVLPHRVVPLVFSSVRETVLAMASRLGRATALNRWKHLGCDFVYSTPVAYAVGCGGSMQVLAWWDQQGCLEEAAVDLAQETWKGAFEHGHALLLEWIHDRYDEHFGTGTHVNRRFWSPGPDDWLQASRLGHVQVLDWAMRKLPTPDDWSTFFFTEFPMDVASQHGHVAVLEWWSACLSEYELVYTHEALELASAAGHVPVLDWWSHSGLELAFTPRVVHLAMQHGHAQVVRWWHACGVYKQVACPGSAVDTKDRLVSRHPITLASFGHLRWLREYCCDLDDADFTLLHAVRQVAVRFGRINVLEEYSDALDSLAEGDGCRWGMALTAATEGRLDVLQWYIKTSGWIRGTNDEFVAVMWRQVLGDAVRADQVHILEWILASSQVKRLLFVVNDQEYRQDELALTVSIAWKSGSVKCLELFYLLGMLTPMTLTPGQVAEGHSMAKEWWYRRFPEARVEE